MTCKAVELYCAIKTPSVPLFLEEVFSGQKSIVFRRWTLITFSVTVRSHFVFGAWCTSRRIFNYNYSFTEGELYYSSHLNLCKN